MAEIMADVFRHVVAVFIRRAGTGPAQAYGFELEDVYAFGIRSIRTKWRAAGYALEDMPPGVLPLDFSLPEEEMARRVLILAAAGALGQPNPPRQVTPEIQALFSDTMPGPSTYPGKGPRRLCIQWRFSDAQPWHVVIDQVGSAAAAGEAASPDVTIESPWKEWIELAAHGVTRPCPSSLVGCGSTAPHGHCSDCQDSFGTGRASPAELGHTATVPRGACVDRCDGSRLD